MIVKKSDKGFRIACEVRSIVCVCVPVCLYIPCIDFIYVVCFRIQLFRERIGDSVYGLSGFTAFSVCAWRVDLDIGGSCECALSVGYCY